MKVSSSHVVQGADLCEILMDGTSSQDLKDETNYVLIYTCYSHDGKFGVQGYIFIVLTCVLLYIPSYDITSWVITCHLIVSCHAVSFYGVVSHSVISHYTYCVVSCCISIFFNHIVWCHIVWRNIIGYHFTFSWVASHCVEYPFIVWCQCVILCFVFCKLYRILFFCYDIVWHHIAYYQIIFYCLASHCVEYPFVWC